MKKSLVVMVVLAGTLALAGSVIAQDWACFEMPPCKIICKDDILCKGQAKGIHKLCGPCAPVIKWSGSWLYVAKCPEVKGVKVAKVIKKAIKKKMIEKKAK